MPTKRAHHSLYIIRLSDTARLITCTQAIQDGVSDSAVCTFSPDDRGITPWYIMEYGPPYCGNAQGSVWSCNPSPPVTPAPAPSRTTQILRCASQIAPSIGQIGNCNPGWFAQNHLGNDISTAVGIAVGPDRVGSGVSALFSNLLNNVGTPTSLVGIVQVSLGRNP